MASVIAADSAICFIDGDKGRLVYRGYDIETLARRSTFCETAYLLWYGHLPGPTELQAFLESTLKGIQVPVETTMILRMFPRDATPMEMLRTAVSSMGHWDPDSGNITLDACLRKAVRLMARIPMLVTAHHRLREGFEPIAPIPGQSLAYNFLYTLTGKEPTPEAVKLFDVSLILHADHGFNASTFTARVVASTLSDMYSAVTAAIGALKGPLHGGANEKVMEMLDEIGSADQAEAWVKNALAHKVKVPGFGHRVYRTEDPRAKILRTHARRLARQCDHPEVFKIAQRVHDVMRDNTKVSANVDFYSGICYRAIGIPSDLFTPIFACSRIVGWTAHILEQWANNRIIRPRAGYVGPLGLKYTPVEKRQTPLHRHIPTY